MLTAAAPRPVLALKANVSWTLAGNICYAAAQWAMLALIAKLGDTRMVGQFALAVAIVGPVMLFASLQLRPIQATDAAGRYRFGQYLALRLVSNVLALVAVAGLVAGVCDGATARVAMVIAMGKCFEGLSDVCCGAFQQRERMDLIAKSLMLRGGLAVAGVAAALPYGLLPAVAAMATAFGLVALLYDWRNAARMLGALRPDAEGIRELARLALPLGVVYLLTALTSNMPRYFVAHALGTSAVGVFAALAYLTVIGATVVGALGQTASPRLARLHAEGRRKEFRLALAKLLGAGALIGLGGVVVALLGGRELLSLAYRPAYAEHSDVLVWLMAAGGFGFIGSLLGYAMTAARSFKAQVPLTATVALVTAAGCAALVPVYGLIGAAMALLLGALVQCVGGAWVVWHAANA